MNKKILRRHIFWRRCSIGKDSNHNTLMYIHIMKKENSLDQEIITKVSKWGNSLGIRIPKKIID